MSLDEIKITYESDHGLKIKDVFSEFDPNPIGNASLAQVHKAKLKSNGETVAVKLQYPRLRAQYNMDLTIIRKLV